MICYLVGGAVRDRLLGRPARDADWLVIGTTPHALIDLGYKPVGASFTTYLHPETREEYSFPRGPALDSDPTEQVSTDLQLRDLTINAMAIDPAGQLIDPLNGRSDLDHRILRHTTAFTQDPLRILRTARLLADLSPYQFQLADSTLELMRSMNSDNRLAEVAKERIWSEFERGIAGPAPRLFIETLRDSGTLALLLPELEQLFGVPQPAKHHPEIDCGEHALLSLEIAAELSTDSKIRFAALIHDLGKGTTPKAEWPRHIAHEPRGVALIKRVSARLGTPKEYQQLASLCCQFHTHCHRAFELKPKTLLRLIEKLDVLRKPQRLEQFLLVCEADARGRKGYQSTAYPQADYLRQIAETVRTTDLGRLNLQQLPVERRANEVATARLSRIATIAEKLKAQIT